MQTSPSGQIKKTVLIHADTDTCKEHFSQLKRNFSMKLV